MIEQAFARFDILGARVVHRVGLLQPQDQIVLVAVSLMHRGQSFQACEFLMDHPQDPGAVPEEGSHARGRAGSTHASATTPRSRAGHRVGQRLIRAGSLFPPTETERAAADWPALFRPAPARAAGRSRRPRPARPSRAGRR